MCGPCREVPVGLRLVAAHRSAVFGAALVVDLDAPSLAEACQGWMVRVFELIGPASITPDGDEHHSLATRDESVAAYRHLDLEDLIAASRWCTTVAGHYVVDRILVQRFGPRPPGMVNQSRSPARQVLWLAHDVVDLDRRRLVAAELSDDDLAAITEARDDEAHQRARARRSRALDQAVENARHLADTGHYLTPTERDVLGITR